MVKQLKLLRITLMVVLVSFASLAASQIASDASQTSLPSISTTPTGNKVDIMAQDDNTPMEITAEIFEFDNKQGIAIYTDDVVADQGTRHLTADKLYLYRHESGEVEKMIAHGKGKLAKLRLKTDIDKPMLHGQGETIRYERKNQKVYLIGNAKLTQGGDVYTAPRIEYNLATEVVRSPMSAQGRTKIILQPRKNT